jgi:hypothetical protein
MIADARRYKTNTQERRTIQRLHPGDAMSKTGNTAGPLELAIVLKRFEEPDEVREMQKGKYEVVRIGGQTLGRATYQPGWKWSEHVGRSRADRCSVEHLGLVLSGSATAAMDDGSITELRAGQLFYIPPVPHDSWVVGDEPYVAVHFLGADRYAS